MIQPRKLVWTEGLFMTPQHLQQCDAYHEAMVHSRGHSIVPYDWGITDVQFDDRALTAGQVRVTKLHGIFQDGTPFFVGSGRSRCRGPLPLQLPSLRLLQSRGSATS